MFGLGWLVFALVVILLIVGIALIVQALLRGFRREPVDNEARRELDKRFARGDVDIEEYQRRRDALKVR